MKLDYKDNYETEELMLTDCSAGKDSASPLDVRRSDNQLQRNQPEYLLKDDEAEDQPLFLYRGDITKT